MDSLPLVQNYVPASLHFNKEFYTLWHLTYPHSVNINLLLLIKEVKWGGISLNSVLLKMPCRWWCMCIRAYYLNVTLTRSQTTVNH